MSRLTLDTSAYCWLLRGEPGAKAAISRADWIGMPAIVIGELVHGFRGGSRPEENEALLGEFLADRRVEVQVLDEEAARLYAEIVEDLKRARTPIPTNDAWIAAAAIRDGATVLTFDPHFERIARVGKRLLKRP